MATVKNQGHKARGRFKDPVYRSAEEKDYADNHLEPQRREGLIRWWAYEPLTLKLCDGRTWKPDFLVLSGDDSLEVHEVKGGLIREAAKVRMSVAADRFPFKFFLCQRRKKQWTIEEI